MLHSKLSPICYYVPPGKKKSWWRCSDVFLYAPATSHRYVSKEAPNNLLMECCQEVSVERLYYVILEHCDDVSRGRNKDVLSVRLRDVSNKSKIKHPTASQWYTTKTSQCLGNPRCPMNTSLQRLMQVSNEPPSDVAVVCLNYIFQLYYLETLLVGL